MKLLKLFSLCLVLLSLAGCADSVKIEDIESVTQVVTEAQLHEFKEYPNLKTLDISGSTCYPAILKFMEDCPQVDVTYTVALGGVSVSNKDTSAAVTGADGAYDILNGNLRYLPNLKELTLTRTPLTAQELTALREGYSRIAIDYTVDLLGQEYPADAVQADLSSVTAEGLEDLMARLPLLPELAEAELMDSSGSGSLSMAQVKALMDAFPHIQFHYTFSLFGKTLSTDDEAVEFVNADIGDQGEEQIRAALSILPRCTRFLLDDCGLSNDVMAGIREDFPNTKVVWRVHFGKYSILTDAEVLRAVYNVFNDTSKDLRYCTDVKYIDMGHNTELSDISFMGYMPKLEIVIVSGSAISDLSCFASCPNLEFLEIAYCSNVEDLSPLENCTKLRFLNVSFTKVKDLQPLDNLPLERFVCLKPRASYEEQEFFKTFHPDCWTRFTGEDPYSLGWRYDDIGETFSEFYKKMREIFGYDKMNS